MILDMNYWRNKTEEKFWIQCYSDLAKQERNLLNCKGSKQLEKFSKWLQLKGFKVLHDKDHIVIEIPDEDYMFMYLTYDAY